MNIVYDILSPGKGVTCRSQRRVRRITSRDDAASAQEQVIDPPHPSSPADDAFLLGLRDVDVVSVIFDRMTCAVDAADCTPRISNSFSFSLVRMALQFKCWFFTLDCAPEVWPGS